MSLPNEIDQDVACPDCGEAFAILDDGAGRCENGNCVSAHEWRSRKHVAALRNQRKPGTTEIPDAELETLREAKVAWERCTVGDIQETAARYRACVDAILAHIPAKVDTVAVLRHMADDRMGGGRYFGDPGIQAEVAALEAAIEAMERKP